MSVTDAARLMVEHRIGALPVLEGGMLVGIVTEGDLIMQDVKAASSRRTSTSSTAS